MGKPTVESVVIRIEKEMADSSSRPSRHFKIFRAIRDLEEKENLCFSPEITSLIPSRARDRITINRSGDTIREHKMGYVKLVLQRNDTSVKRLIEELKNVYENVEAFYKSELIFWLDEWYAADISADMMVDGIFVVELFRRYKNPELLEQDTIRFSHTTQDQLVGDLLVMENQLPFFVMENMFDATLMENEQPNQFIPLALHFLSKTVMQGFTGNYNFDHHQRCDEIKHLLDLLHKCWRPDPTINRNVEDVVDLYDMPCATKLVAQGIGLKEDSRGVSLFDIRFRNEVLLIPKLTLDRQGEKVFLNLLDHEQRVYDDLDSASRYVTDYVKFMATLIITAEDVKLLRSCGIIKCEPGKDELVVTMFRKLADNVFFSSRSSCYLGIVSHVQNHSKSKKVSWKRKWNSWKATFWHDYFRTPWLAISVIAAAVLLILTIAQTTYTILPYYRPHK